MAGQTLQQILQTVEVVLPDYDFRFLMKERIGTADIQQLLRAVESALDRATADSEQQQQLCAARGGLLQMIWRKTVAA